MTERHTVKLIPSNRAKALAGVEIAIAKGVGRDAKPWTMELRERTRTDDQNDALHGLIAQIMRQRTHHNGVRMDKALWKAVFMQALGEEVTMLPKLDGDGFFPLGLRTSALGVARFAELMELILAWCAREGLTVEHFDSDRGSAGDNSVEVAA